MTPDGSPRIATWLLVRLVSGPQRESLIGDLLERYQQKRSTLWYWHQVIAAIIATNASEIWNHRTLALRAIVLGWSMTYALDLVYGMFLTATLPSSLFQFSSTRGASLLPHVLNSAVLVGTIQTAVVRVSTGWLIARSHRPYQVSMAFAFLSSFLILDLPWLLRRGLDAAAAGNTVLIAAFAIHLVSVMVTVFGVTVGLMWGGRRRRVAA